MARLRSFIRPILLLGALVCASAQAYEFVPTTAEFSSWPRHCQARYVTTDIGRQQPWSSEYPQSIVDQQMADIGWDTFEKLHHYCAGIIWLNRSRLEHDLATKKFDLRTARAEVLFTYRGVEKRHPLAINIMITLAQVCQASADYTCATDTLEKAVDLHPSAAAPYSALAVMYRDRKRLDLAHETLIRGDKATEGKSPEINYNLGLLLVEMKDYSAAVERAKRAYELGYPLPGLRNKLVRLDKWPTGE
jgi:tetratricopeptide (TPR) repeat protein